MFNWCNAEKRTTGHEEIKTKRKSQGKMLLTKLIILKYFLYVVSLLKEGPLSNLFNPLVAGMMGCSMYPTFFAAPAGKT
jgi:hypothetical protein